MFRSRGRRESKLKKPSPRWWRWTKIGLCWLAFALCLTFIGGSLYAMSIMRALEPRVAKLQQFGAELHRDPTIIYSSDGVEIARMAQERRDPVSWPELPQLVIDATVAAEDKRFWTHRGVDHTAIIRAFWSNYRAGDTVQGGSTITQQLAKRLLTSGERTFRRKIEDACLAVLIEQEYTKEQVLTMYLNQVFYGAGSYGVKAAAETYFGKDLHNLTISEAALLARLPRRPSTQNPYVNLDVAIKNRDYVLSVMREENLISEEQYREALKEEVKLQPKPIQTTGISQAPYFSTWIVSQLREEFPNEDFARGGFKIYTTLNIDAQRAAEKALQETLNQYKRQKVTEGAIVVADINGQVMAMVGGADFKRSQYNNITQGRRQPGSAFKPFVYAAAMEMGYIKPTSMISNERFVWTDPSTRKSWIPKGGGGGGLVSVQTALVRSINVPAVHTTKIVGASNVARYAREVFGIRSKLDPVLPLGLGSSAVNPLEMAEAYSVFMTGGNRVKMYGIKRIVSPSGSIVKEFTPRIVANVLSESTALPLRDMMRRVVLEGTATKASGVANAAGKTGTNDDYLDAWFCGFTDRLVAVAWVSNATYDPNRNPPWKYGSMSGVFGGDAPTFMWARTIKPIQELIGEKPSGRRPNSYGGGGATEMTVLVCLETGSRAVPGHCPRTETRVMQATEARDLPTCGVHAPIEHEPKPVDPGDPIDPPPPSRNPPVSNDLVEFEICIDSNARATQYCPVRRIESFRRTDAPRNFCRIHAPEVLWLLTRTGRDAESIRH